MHGYPAGYLLAPCPVRRMASFFVVCLPVPVPARKQEITADVTLAVPLVPRPVTVTRYFHRVTITRRIDVSPVARVPVPSATVPVITLVVAVPLIMGHF